MVRPAALTCFQVFGCHVGRGANTSACERLGLESAGVWKSFGFVYPYITTSCVMKASARLAWSPLAHRHGAVQCCAKPQINFRKTQHFSNIHILLENLTDGIYSFVFISFIFLHILPSFLPDCSLVFPTAQITESGIAIHKHDIYSFQGDIVVGVIWLSGSISVFCFMVCLVFVRIFTLTMFSLLSECVAFYQLPRQILVLIFCLQYKDTLVPFSWICPSVPSFSSFCIIHLRFLVLHFLLKSK